MTIIEIAKLANVGTSTVSRYLNGGSVSLEKKIVIERVIKENNYTPNIAASNMRGKSKEIAIFVQRINSQTASRFLNGAVERCIELNFTPTIYTTNFDEERQQRYIDMVIKQGVRGIVLNAFSEDLNVDSGKTIVCISGQHSDKYPCININGYEPMYELVNNVLKYNVVQSIEFVGVEIMDISILKRLEGVVKAATEHDVLVNTCESDFDSALKDLVITKGIFYVCATDKIAYHIIKNANNQGLTIGVDYLVSGYGNYDSSDIVELTSVSIDYEQLGKSSIDVINEQETCDYDKYEIVYRKSTCKKK